ncbi:proline-rich protein 7 isoform X2 [Agelaius phoeniceus]|uniref:proline-rich protein 7 isoform X2 n=1 Tax=Agelaius phoeniceus TaxID=39638 RepID=UPI004054F310
MAVPGGALAQGQLPRPGWRGVCLGVWHPRQRGDPRTPSAISVPHCSGGQAGTPAPQSHECHCSGRVGCGRGCSALASGRAALSCLWPRAGRHPGSTPLSPLEEAGDGIAETGGSTPRAPPGRMQGCGPWEPVAPPQRASQGPHPTRTGSRYPGIPGPHPVGLPRRSRGQPRGCPGPLATGIPPPFPRGRSGGIPLAVPEPSRWPPSGGGSRGGGCGEPADPSPSRGRGGAAGREPGRAGRRAAAARERSPETKAAPGGGGGAAHRARTGPPPPPPYGAAARRLSHVRRRRRAPTPAVPPQRWAAGPRQPRPPAARPAGPPPRRPPGAPRPDPPAPAPPSSMARTDP